MLSNRVQDLLAQYTANSLLRNRHVVEQRDNNNVFLAGESLINFCSNDYLNLSTDAQVKKAFIQGVSQYGLGSGASPLVNGYSKAHAKLEEAFADFLNRDSALLFNSGYHANLGVLGALAARKSVIVADKYCHASLHEGAALTRATFRRYRHNDLTHTNQLLQQYVNQEILLAAESVFSMQGDIANVKELASLAKKHHAMLLVDDAHGIGVLGKQGRGACEHFNLTQTDVPCLITPLGKALGSMGAIVSGDKSIIEAILQFAKSYRYSTALPAAVCHATLTALTLLKTDTWRRQKLIELVLFFIKEAQARKLPLYSTDKTPIKSIVIGDNRATLAMQEKLAQDGLLVACIRPPTVPTQSACIRISLNCMHSEAQIIYLLDKCNDHYAQ